MKKIFTLLFLYFIVCLYSCNNNYQIGPVNPPVNQYDTVLFQTIDSFAIYSDTSIADTSVVDSLLFFLSTQGLNEVVLNFTIETNIPQSSSVVPNIRIILGDSTSDMQTNNVHTYLFSDITTITNGQEKSLDTYRHQLLRFAQAKIKMSFIHNFSQLEYYIRIKNLKLFKVVLL